MNRGLWDKSHWHRLLDRTVVVLGEVMECVLHNPDTGAFQGWEPNPGLVLACSSDGRRLFMVRPERDLGPRRLGKSAVHAFNLHERFMHRKADGYYNVEVKDFARPRFRGELVILRYLAAKDIDDDSKGEVIWEHYFEQPGVEPRYPEFWDVGNGQYYVPPGPFAVTEEGIVYAAAA